MIAIPTVADEAMWLPIAYCSIKSSMLGCAPICPIRRILHCVPFVHFHQSCSKQFRSSTGDASYYMKSIRPRSVETIQHLSMVVRQACLFGVCSVKPLLVPCKPVTITNLRDDVGREEK
jgi:hypothetical protein